MFSQPVLEILGSCAHAVSQSYGLMTSLLLAGLVGSIGHCVGMCGPFVMAQSGHMQKLKDAALLPYHFGRITTYVVMALVFSSVLNLAFLFLPIRHWVIAPLLMLAGVVFLVSAFPRLGSVFPWASALRLPFSADLFSKPLAFLSRKRSAIRQYFMGVLLGFMPCGLVISALMASASAPSVWQAGLAMAAFGLGTVPALVATALGGQALKYKFPHITGKLAKGFMALSALWLFVLAGMMLI
jgi:sulfite exporter TauE/SafE